MIKGVTSIRILSQKVWINWWWCANKLSLNWGIVDWCRSSWRFILFPWNVSWCSINWGFFVVSIVSELLIRKSLLVLVLKFSIPLSILTTCIWSSTSDKSSFESWCLHTKTVNIVWVENFLYVISIWILAVEIVSLETVPVEIVWSHYFRVFI
jgi:hypothetical protein